MLRVREYANEGRLWKPSLPVYTPRGLRQAMVVVNTSGNAGALRGGTSARLSLGCLPKRHACSQSWTGWSSRPDRQALRQVKDFDADPQQMPAELPKQAQPTIIKRILCLR